MSCLEIEGVKMLHRLIGHALNSLHSRLGPRLDGVKRMARNSGKKAAPVLLKTNWFNLIQTYSNPADRFLSMTSKPSEIIWAFRSALPSKVCTCQLYLHSFVINELMHIGSHWYMGQNKVKLRYTLLHPYIRPQKSWAHKARLLRSFNHAWHRPTNYALCFGKYELFTSLYELIMFSTLWLHYICVVKDSAHHLMPSFGSIWFKIIQNLSARSCSLCNGFDVWELEPLCSVRSARKLNMHELGSRKSANNISYMFLIVLACFGQM